MKYALVIFLLTFIAHAGLSQKTIKGAYEGELVTPKSVLLINHQKDSVLKGLVYTSQLDNVPFYGFYAKQEIRGTIFMPPEQGDIVIMYGKLHENTIDVTLISSIDSAVIVKSKLIKVSGSTTYNISKTFGKIEPQYDEQLVGTWVYLYAVKEDGQKVEDKPFMAGMSVYYLANGTFTINIPMLAELTAKYTVPVGKRTYTRMTWFTYEDKLVTKTQIHIPPALIEKLAQMGLPAPPPTDSNEMLSAYQVKGDTLIKTDSKMTRSYYLRKK
ncbi:MAG: hypothetical protein ACK4RF_12170 [Cyclobacteriaceae bacterium]